MVIVCFDIPNSLESIRLGSAKVCLATVGRLPVAATALYVVKCAYHDNQI